MMRAWTCLLLVLCLVACVGCGREKTTAELIQDLNSNQEKDRIVAVRLLGARKRDPAEAVPALVKALQDDEGDIRWSAAIGLGYFGGQAKEAVPALEAARKDRDARVREAAGVALTRIDPGRFPAGSGRQAAWGK